MGETIVFHIVTEPVQLSIPRCEDLGLLTKVQTRLASEGLFVYKKGFLSVNVKGQKKLQITLHLQCDGS